MNTIDITTAQKVTITYSLATFWERMLAFFIDLIIIIIVAVILFYINAVIFRTFSKYSVYFTVIPWICFYSLLFHSLNYGQTLGKMILQLRVVKIDGRKASFTDYVLRWAFRPVDFWFSFGTIAVIICSTSEKNQRLGDLLANTTVIKILPPSGYSLPALINMKNKENYSPTFAQVANMPEKDIVIIKNLLDRLAKHPNEAHYQALELAVEKVCHLLDIEPMPYPHSYKYNEIIKQKERKKRINFLQVILQDYIYLTR